jgi:beta-galactosidase
MRTRELFNDGWQFYYGEAGPIRKTVNKSGSIGGFASVLPGERGEAVKMGPAGKFFLDLIAADREDENSPVGMVFGTGSKVSTADWRPVRLPHDWKTELEYTPQKDVFMAGAKENGVAYYRKAFSLAGEDEGRHIAVEFNGVCRSASVWFNGCFLGDHYSGYTSFCFDLTDLANYGDEGDNVLLVRVDTTTGDEGWWYEGAGIYRDVYLVKTDALHVDTWGAYIHLDKLEDHAALMIVETTLVNRGYTSRSARLDTVFFDDRGNKAGSAETPFTLDPLGSLTLIQRITVPEPRLWSPETPALYKALSTITEGDVVVDEYPASFGIRTVAYTTEGLLLNGKPVPLKGTCVHQDFAGLGAALPGDIQEYKIQKLLEMGSNAYRSAHHPADPALLDICDRLGMLVMDENRLLESSELRLGDLRDLVKRDRNHPSVVLWSLCNEEMIGGSSPAVRMLRHLANEVRRLDKTRPVVSAELLPPGGALNPEYFKIFDVLGLNYPESPLMGDNLSKVKASYPEGRYLNSETASYFSTRGAYSDDWERCQNNNFGSRFSMMSPGKDIKDPVGAGGTARPEQALGFYAANPYTGGVFIWTGFDYRGEPSPFPWPAISSQFGIMDTCGFPKDYYYYYKAHWTTSPLIHVMPHWTWPGREGETLRLRVFSNCEEAEILVNGRSAGRKPCGSDWTEWELPYTPGILEAVAYRGGKEAAREIHKTAGVPVALALEPASRGGSRLRPGGVAVIAVSALDREGNSVPAADNNVSFEVAGNGRLLGLGNGDPADHSSDTYPVRRLFAGKAAAIIEAGTGKGSLILKAVSPDLAGAALEFAIENF